VDLDSKLLEVMAFELVWEDEAAEEVRTSELVWEDEAAEEGLEVTLDEVDGVPQFLS
jgi:hypothetical protein